MASKLPGLILVGRHASTLPALTGHSMQQKRTIVSKAYLKLPDDYPDPWPYQEKGYTRYHAFVDWTKKRLHQNSKLIVVEGNIGSGKSTVASEMADILGFKYMPEFKMDDILIDRYGNDLRKFYHLFPKCMRMPDINMFYANPFDDNTARMQYRMLECRWEQYLNALAHILNTGEGVVLERSPHTDFVFVNAMRTKNYISPEFFRLYYYVRKFSLPNLRYWPHLVVYLDAPVKKCLERIKQRGNPNEIAVVDEEYLSVMAESYKDALREFKPHSKILAYDWSTPGTADMIVQDIEKIDFDFFEWHSGDVFEEWHQPKDEWWVSLYRHRVTQKMDLFLQSFNGHPTHECGELYVDINDLGHFILAMKTHVLKGRLGYGYYPDKGDDRGAGARVWGWTQHLPEKWWEYYWRDVYFHRLHSFETYVDPYARSYDPDYLHHHH
ncbi:NADH dehydrogenase [ubiquinone] 1 alpha subcomplex subunit 10, mitochondrial [Aphelenchoides bicaudatus]|nr:NADH dehydrogenase [ubiquinone] 1 alpha subcomplex subunit 10, mitochondrial [Aphelenchoides bicaudatus]